MRIAINPQDLRDMVSLIRVSALSTDRTGQAARILIAKIEQQGQLTSNGMLTPCQSYMAIETDEAQRWNR